MPATCTTAAETREVLDRPQLLVRTTQFLKRVSNFRTASRKGDSPNRPSGIARAAQSMDLGSKVDTKLEVRPHHSFDQSRDSGEDSPSHLSLRGSLHPNRASSSTTDSPLGPPSHQIDGLPRTTYRFLAPATTTTVPTSITSHTRSQTLPSGNPTGAAIPPHNAHAHSHSTIGPSGRRALAPRLATLPPPLMAQYTAGGSARLTPSWITRQPPMPLLNLPTLPPPTPPQPARSPRPTAPLRSLPALPMQGPSDTEREADHENASVDDEDEEEDGDEHAGVEVAEPEGDSDSSGEDTSMPSASSLAGPSRISGLPEVDTSGFNVSFGGTGSPRTPQASPRAGPFIDYFTSKRPEVEPPDRTPRPSDFRPNGKARAAPERGEPQPRVVSMPQPRIVPMPMFTPMPATPGSSAAPRPNLYHHASKSMVDLMSLTRKDKDKVYSPKLGRATPKIAQDPVSVPTPATAATTTTTPAVAAHKPAAPPPQMEPRESESDDVIQSSMLRRRRSLPVYEPSSDPPPYPDPLFRRRAQAAGAEEEGTERLPGYANAIYMAGVMPRKMEFTAPGMQAKDRKWRRVYCVLEGTAFRVFKCPPAASRVAALEQWWERKVGAGDFTSVDVSAVTASGVRVSAIRERERLREGEDAPERIPKIVEEPAPGPARTPESQREPERQRERELQPSSPPPPSPPASKSRLGLTSRFLRRQRSKSSSRTLSTLSVSANESTGSSMRMSMDSRVSENSRHPSHSATRHSMDTVGSSGPSVASSSNTHSTACTGLTVPSPTSGPGSTTPTERSARRRSFLSQSTSGSSSSGGSPPEQTDKAKGKEKEKDQGGYMPDAKKDLLKQYSLQNAESGLASDYQKRKNVIRVRMEGQQFLLQAKDVAAVIDWIESIQMGTNVALDLDDRPMPRGPIFPRRRRRRPRRPDPANANTSSTGRPTTAAAGS